MFERFLHRYWFGVALLIGLLLLGLYSSIYGLIKFIRAANIVK